jgi:hypothetical protein
MQSGQFVPGATEYKGGSGQVSCSIRGGSVPAGKSRILSHGCHHSPLASAALRQSAFVQPQTAASHNKPKQPNAISTGLKTAGTHSVGCLGRYAGGTSET